MNCLIQSVDGYITGVGLVVVAVASGFGAGLCIISKLLGEYLERKEQHNLKEYTLALRTLHDSCKPHSKCLEDNKVDLNEYNKLKQSYDTYKTNETKLNCDFSFLS